MVLNRQIPRKIKGNLLRYIGILLLLIVGITIVTGYNCAAASVLEKLNDSKKFYNVEDGDFQVYMPLSDEQKSHIEDLGFKIEEQFYYDFEKDGSTLRIFEDREGINKLEKTKGSADISGNEIFFDKMYGENKEYEIGGEVKIDGEKYIVKGMGCVPDYILIISDLTQNSSDAEKFGLAFVSGEYFDKFPDDEITYNYAFKNDKNWSENKTEDKISELKDYLKDECYMTGFLKNEDSTRVSGIFTKLESDRSTAFMLGIVVMIIIAFLFFAITKTTVSKECKAIGTLYAQGYTAGEIRRYYIKLPLILTVIGSVVGYILGSNFMMQPLIASAYSFYCIPNVELVQSGGRIAATIILPFVIVFIINEIGLAKSLSAQPLSLLRGDLKQGRICKLKMKRFSFMTRFRLRILIKSIGDNLLLIVGIILSCFLLIMGIGMNGSLDTYITQVQSDVPSEYVYVLNSQVKTYSKDAEKLKMTQLDYYFEQADRDMTLTCYGIEDDSKYIDADVKGVKGMVISDVVAEKFGIEKGDTIELSDASGEETYEVKVDGICDFPMGLYVFMDREELNKLVGDEKDDYNAYFSDKKLYFNDDDVSSIITKEDTVKSAEQYYDMTSSTISMVCIAAVIIALILMFIIFEMTIDKNKYSISLGKILGYNPRELGSIFIDGKLIVVIIGILIAIPLDLYLMKEMWPSLILTFRGFIPFELSGENIALIAIIELIAYFVVRFAVAVSLKKVQLTYVLKDRE